MLVIIGLIVGGILVGQTLIATASVRGQISQIAKFNAAVNAFKGKTGYLPGDIPAVPAAQFGFAARGQYAGEGDGNGIIEGIVGNAPSNNCTCVATGEAPMFWVDLSAANMIDGGFNTASSTAPPSSNVMGSGVGNYMPAAKIGRGNYIYVWSGGAVTNTGGSMNQNLFGLAAVNEIFTTGAPNAYAGLTVQEAYSIDKKIDDGLPTSGTVQTAFVGVSGGGYTGVYWPTGVAGVYANFGAPTSPSPTTCYDNGGTSNPMAYSITTNNGAGVNCTLSFRFQ